MNWWYKPCKHYTYEISWSRICWNILFFKLLDLKFFLKEKYLNYAFTVLLNRSLSLSAVSDIQPFSSQFTLLWNIVNIKQQKKAKWRLIYLLHLFLRISEDICGAVGRLLTALLASQIGVGSNPCFSRSDLLPLLICLGKSWRIG